MTAPIDIYEYRVGNPPPGFWRYVYDTYPSGKPVEEAEEQGRAVFAAYRSHAPGTIPIFQHKYTYAPVDMTFLDRFVIENERTPVSFELDELSSASDLPALSGRVLAGWHPLNYVGGWDREGDPNREIWAGGGGGKTSSGSSRAFWAFPVPSGERDTVAVYEHRLEVDVVTNRPRHGYGRGPDMSRLMGRCLAYLKYSTSENGGVVFDGRRESQNLSTSAHAWWRTEGSSSDHDCAYLRYTRKIAFYAHRPLV